MKKSLLLILLFSTIAPAYAQLTFGLKAGGNLNGTAIKVPTDFSYETASHLSFHAGVFTHVSLSDKLALIPELQFIQKGYVFEGFSNDVRINLNYLELPVMVSYSPVKQLSLEAGPAIGYRLSAKAVTKTSSADRKDTYDQDIELSVAGGLRFSFSEKLSITARYYRGLTDISRFFFTYDGITGELSDMYNTGVQVALYYGFGR